MQYKLYKYATVVAMTLVFLQLSCKKFVEIDPPKGAVVTATAFGDSATATSAVLGVYNQMIYRGGWYLTDGGITIYTGLSSDELYSTKNIPDELEFYRNAVSINSMTNTGNLWQTGYRLMYDVNACLEGLTESKGLSLFAKNQLTGEMKFIRAFLYFNLVNLYGDVPLVTTTSFAINGIMPRTSTDSVYAQMVRDLTDAYGLLSAGYPTDGRVRPNKYAAEALLARVFLYKGEWAKAEEAASVLINAGIYSLEPDLNHVFLASSQEAIYQILPVLKGWESTEGVNLITKNKPTAFPAYVITDVLLNAFESGDQRKVNWLNSNTVSGKSYYWPFKYHLGYDKNTTPVEPYMILRLAEQYLIRAEARARQNNIAGGTGDLNAIRNRAGLSDTTTNDQTVLLAAVMHERQIELFCEWGHRWYDLKRSGQIDALLGIEKPGWKPTMALYPIPFLEIKANPRLKQNEGYN